MRVEVLVWIKDKIRGRYLGRHMDHLEDMTFPFFYNFTFTIFALIFWFPVHKKINIENPGNQVNYWGGGGGGLNHPIYFAGYLFSQY